MLCRKRLAVSVGAAGFVLLFVRLPQVHDTVKQGLVSYAIRVAREKGVFGVRRRCVQSLARGSSPGYVLLYRLALRRQTRARGFMRSGKRECRCEISLPPSVEALRCPSLLSRPKRPSADFGWLGEPSNGISRVSSSMHAGKAGVEPHRARPDLRSSRTCATSRCKKFERTAIWRENGILRQGQSHHLPCVLWSR